ncbi:MAG TPA: hypothetical protein VJT49_32360 [Amycolatopsis sp.]|uniref:hypothetical protein n=1 Tax=Amycolatopsis sp. TaxID=37632 RepID=UPI002B47757C|nr:hypothetical protein [Amycolatopsis sp.]HKS49717.1 hypothetical protein [Amycolatopsis sp.]
MAASRAEDSPHTVVTVPVIKTVSMPRFRLQHRWADGVHVNIRLEAHELCPLVVIGIRADGRKELAALADGYR